MRAADPRAREILRAHRGALRRRSSCGCTARSATSGWCARDERRPDVVGASSSAAGPDCVERGRRDGAERAAAVRLRPPSAAATSSTSRSPGGRRSCEAIDEDDRGQGPPRGDASTTTPGRTSARSADLGHRFFFSAGEVEPLEPRRRPASAAAAACSSRASATSSSATTASASRWPGASHGARAAAGWTSSTSASAGMDLAYALQDGLRGGRPGRRHAARRAARHALRDRARARRPGEVAIDTHGMDPVRGARRSRARSGRVAPPRTLVVGCEPQTRMRRRGRASIVAELTEPVRAAVERGGRA